VTQAETFFPALGRFCGQSDFISLNGVSSPLGAGLMRGSSFLFFSSFFSFHFLTATGYLSKKGGVGGIRASGVVFNYGLKNAIRRVTAEDER